MDDNMNTKPCKSPYCECSVGECTHPGFHDARGQVTIPIDKMKYLMNLISSDSYAISFQSLRQYRNALIKEIIILQEAT